MPRSFIAEVSKDSGLNIDTIRFYEKVGLINPPTRTRGRFRSFKTEDVRHLRVIRKLRDFGFSLSEMKRVFAMQRRGMDACTEVRDLLRKKIVTVRGKIRLLQQVEQELRHDLRRIRFRRLPSLVSETPNDMQPQQ